MIDDNILDKILGTEKFDDTKILIDTDDKLPDNITLKNLSVTIFRRSSTSIKVSGANIMLVKFREKLVRVVKNSIIVGEKW